MRVTDSAHTVYYCKHNDSMRVTLWRVTGSYLPINSVLLSSTTSNPKLPLPLARASSLACVIVQCVQSSACDQPALP
eukprot:255-Heterococcus_DN1.PRE.3